EKLAESCHKLRRADEGVKTGWVLDTFHPHRRYLMIGWVSQHAYLEIENSIVDSVDEIILSLLIFEHKRRTGVL
ncbi:hypothetical protein EDD17DRAFT_1648115, partial [Pisolithus thermaeus]